MKIVINKLVGDLGEQWAVEFPVPSDVLKAKDPVQAIKNAVAPALRVVDDRLLELNLRLINHNRVAQGLSPEGILAVRQCVEVMYGRRSTPADGPQGQGVQDVKLPEPDAVAGNVEKAGALMDALEGVDQGR